MTTLQVDSLTMSFGHCKVLDNVTFNAKPGTILALFGPNGAGKSTLIKCISGLHKSFDGTILFKKKSILSNNKWRADLRYLPEQPFFYNNLSGKTNLKVYRILLGAKDITPAIQAAKAMGMEHDLRRKVKTYSFGMRQKLGMCGVFLGNPRLILLDEPTNGMDPVTARRSLELIRKIVTDHSCIALISSHHINEVARIADQYMFINKGSIRAAGDMHTSNRVRMSLTTTRPETIMQLLEKYPEVDHIRNEGDIPMLEELFNSMREER